MHMDIALLRDKHQTQACGPLLFTPTKMRHKKLRYAHAPIVLGLHPCLSARLGLFGK